MTPPEIRDSFQGALATAIGGRDGVVLLFVGRECPECGRRLVLAGGTDASAHVGALLERYPKLDMKPDLEWLDEPLRGYLHCEGAACGVGAPVEFSGDGVEAVR